ncbi:MAG: RraA family protein [Clostridiales bacterium]|nr:RraA family protein [Clostridiales bacterium]
MFFSTREEVERLTPNWKGERMEDGRPKVPDSLLERMKDLTLEEVWVYCWARNYEFLVEGDLKTTHPTTNKLIGRALTCICAPFREDLHQVCKAEAQAFGFKNPYYNHCAVDQLVEGDVMVVDFFDKIAYGTFFGGNLSTAVANRTKGGGAVIWGGIRDVDQVQAIPNVQIYYRGSHPTPIRDYVMTGYNRPCQIGGAICMPGDVVFGSSGGVVFIPPHLAEETVQSAEKFHIMDKFGFARLKEGVYAASQIDNAWSKEMWDDFMNWFKTNPETQKFQYLDFATDMENQLKGIQPIRNRGMEGLLYKP